MSEENIHRGHRERLKQFALAEGLDALSDHQALELLLFFALPYKDTNILAHRLLEHFGRFASVLDADYHELLRVPGVGPNTATLLCLLPEFFRRYELTKREPKPMLRTRHQAGEYICKLFIGLRYECFYLVCLNAQRQALKAALLSSGTIDEVAVYPRVAVETALRHQAHSVLLAHNHPAGHLQPSRADLDLTAGIVAALSAIGIPTLDHIVAANNGFRSFTEMGLLPDNW